MTRQIRIILSMILAVMLCVVFSIPSLAFEADEPAHEAEPEETAVTEPAPEPTITVSAPVEIEVIPDDDWGSVEPGYAAMVMAATTEKAMNSEVIEPEETPAPTDIPADEPAAAPDALEPVETELLPTAEEEPETDQPVEELPAANAADEDQDGMVTEDQADTEEPAQEIPEEENTDEEHPEEKPEETVPETETHVTVTVEVSMISENLMYLQAVVNDPEGRDFLYQWQVSEDCGMTYTDIPEATTDELKVELTDENISDMWRVRVQAI